MNENQLNFNHHTVPLWARLRPKSIHEYHDFSNLKKLYHEFIEAPFSFLLHGPPGAGKTTFIELLAMQNSLPFFSLASSSTSLPEVRKLVEKSHETIIIFLDEFHRFSKPGQDYFLKPIEEGKVILLAATTESPWYYVSRPLLSRFRIYSVKAPSAEVFLQILQTQWEKNHCPALPDYAFEITVNHSYPDFRKTIIALEALASEFSGKKNAQDEVKSFLVNYFAENKTNAQNTQKHEYNLLSAYIKSLRGSDANAAILYLGKLLQIGTDPTIIARRLVILASEDIGLANSQALLIANAVLNTVEKIGMPEARIPLAHGTVYLAASPKSNAAYKAINDAMQFCKEVDFSPPEHILNHSLKSSQYLYPHDQGGWVEQNYWPENIPFKKFYDPQKGVFPESKEAKVKEILDRLNNA